MRCVCHLINLAVDKFWKCIRHMPQEKAMLKATRLVEYISRSTRAWGVLRDIQIASLRQRGEESAVEEEDDDAPAGGAKKVS